MYSSKGHIKRLTGAFFLADIQTRAVASGPAGQAMAGPVLINYVDTHAQMQQLSAMVLLRVESRLNILHSCLDLLAASFLALLP